MSCRLIFALLAAGQLVHCATKAQSTETLSPVRVKLMSKGTNLLLSSEQPVLVVDL